METDDVIYFSAEQQILYRLYELVLRTAQDNVFSKSSLSYSFEMIDSAESGRNMSSLDQFGMTLKVCRMNTTEIERYH